MKVLKLLVELNIGLSTLNDELNWLGLPTVQINDKLSEEDCSFLKAYFNSQEMKEIDALSNQINERHHALRYFFLRDKKSPFNMGEMEKRQLFYIIFNKCKSVKECPKIEEYSEDSFWTLYNWYSSWVTKH